MKGVCERASFTQRRSESRGNSACVRAPRPRRHLGISTTCFLLADRERGRARWTEAPTDDTEVASRAPECAGFRLAGGVARRGRSGRRGQAAATGLQVKRGRERPVSRRRGRGPLSRVGPRRRPPVRRRRSSVSTDSRRWRGSRVRPERGRGVERIVEGRGDTESGTQTGVADAGHHAWPGSGTAVSSGEFGCGRPEPRTSAKATRGAGGTAPRPTLGSCRGKAAGARGGDRSHTGGMTDVAHREPGPVPTNCGHSVSKARGLQWGSWQTLIIFQPGSALAGSSRRPDPTVGKVASRAAPA